MRNICIESKIKLKTGFFKKESYLLILNDQEIIFIKNNKKPKEFKISAAAVESISISGVKPEEIEIITEKESFIGNFIDENNLSEIILFLKMVYDKRFNFN